MNIAIWGATSHIAKGLIHNFGDKETLHPFNRGEYDYLHMTELDVIINCVGVGTNPKPKTKYFTVTEKFDNLAINYLKKHSECLYISFSSGVVHRPTSSDYATVRLYAEAKHRAFKNLNIVDLRLYSYFSRWINLDDNYFMCDVIKALLNNQTLVTYQFDIIRDFIHPEDLFKVVKSLLGKKKVNRAIEVASSKPINKWEVLDYFKKEYGLKYGVHNIMIGSATGEKPNYVPPKRNPKHKASLQTIKEEAKWLLKERGWCL